MHRVRVAVLGGAAFVGLTAAAHADELATLKAEIAALNGRMAAMEASPSAPQGYRLIAISEGDLVETPGAPLSARERAAYGGRATIISVVAAADAPPAATISWSGYNRAGVVYNGVNQKTNDKAYSLQSGQWVRDPADDVKTSKDTHDTDVSGRAQLMVQAKTDTAVGEVGTELQLRGDYNGNGPADLYAKVAWGYWSMTPDLTLGGGYNQSLGDIVYGYDGSCTCYFTDNADVDFDPGDTTQLRLDYKAGGVTMSAALESGALDNGAGPNGDPGENNGKLGVAGAISYAGDVFNGEIAGVWRSSNKEQTGASQIWQVGAGGSVALGDVGTLALAAATGEGPYEVDSSGTIIDGLAYNNTWWGASLWSSFNLGDQAHIELAGGYKHRKGDQQTYNDYQVSNVDYDTYALMGGLYYTPVAQLTLGLEGEWYTTSTDANAVKDDLKYKVNDTSDTVWADVVAVWSF